MRLPSDSELLVEYTQHGVDKAFATIVDRYANLVFSAAVRQVESPDIAAEITQTVFLALARGATSLVPRMAPGGSLAGWLCRSTRNCCLNHRRDRFRRLKRERNAMELYAEVPEESPTWDDLRQVLDDAMAELSEADYDAVVLRFYQNQDFRTVGAALGVSDNTAQKRVTRALGKLRERLGRRGIRTAAPALTALLSAHAVQGAPAGLATTIFTATLAGKAASGAVASAALPAVTKTFAMTTLHKTLFTTAIVVLAGAGTYEARLARESLEENQILLRRQAQMEAKIRALQLEKDRERAKLVRLPARAAPRLPAPSIQAASLPQEKQQVVNLFERFNELPPQLSPELLQQYLSANGRNASSLLAAYRKSGDLNLLNEAIQRYPEDPLVAFEAVMREDLPPDLRRSWLDSLKRTDPNNALGDYLSALEHIQSGQMDLAVQDLMAAAGKPFQDYSTQRYQDDTEAYLAAGYPMADAKVAAGMQLLLPQLHQVKELGFDMLELARSYQQAGDAVSGQTVLEWVALLGQRYDPPVPGGATVSQLVGLSLQQHALQAMDPSDLQGNTGQTVQERLQDLEGIRAGIIARSEQAGSFYPEVTDVDWINYRDRWLLFGEQNAVTWLVNKYGGP